MKNRHKWGLYSLFARRTFAENCNGCFMNYYRVISCVCYLLLFVPVISKAQSMDSTVFEIKEIVIEAKSKVQTVRESAYNVVAIDAKTMHNSTLDLAHLLDKASGVKIRETGGVGSDMNITMNGFTGRNIRVFMDGTPMQGFGSAFQLNNIPVNMVEHIEVYKGVIPIEFGADALGGVINIVTNRTQNTTVDVSYAYGSFNTHRTNLAFNHTFKSGLSFQLNAFRNYSDNDYKVKTQTYLFPENSTTGGSKGATMSEEQYWVRRFHDRYKNETVVAKIGIVGKSWADRLLLGVTLAQVNKDVQNQANMKYVYGEVTTSNKSILPYFTYEKRNLITDGLSVRMMANYNYQKAATVDTAKYRYNWFGERQPRNGGEMGNSVLSEYSDSNWSATANIGYRINDSHSVSVNDAVSGYIRRPNLAEIEEPTAADSMSRTNFKNTLGLEYRYTLGKKWNTSLFAKHYLNKVSGPETVEENKSTRVYRRKESASQMGFGVASTYFFQDIQLKLSIEKAYRMPTENELFGNEVLETGNIAIKPESSANYNVGVTVNKKLGNNYTLYFDGSIYYRNTKNFIKRTIRENSQTGAYTFGNANHGHVTNLGTDMEARVYYKNKATLGTTLTFMNMRDREKWMYAVAGGVESPTYGERMPNLPYRLGNVDAAYYVHHLLGKGNTLNLNYTFNFTEKIFLKSPNLGYIDSKDVIPGQQYSDFSATYMLKNGKYNITLEVRNMENAFLYDNFSLQKPGRSFTVKFRYYLVTRKK